MIEQRVTELEIKLSYQEDLLQTLNKIVAEQQLQIVRLEHTCQFMHERLNSLQSEKQEGVIEPPPPHY